MDGTSQAQALTVSSDQKKNTNMQGSPALPPQRLVSYDQLEQQQQRQQPTAVRTSGAAPPAGQLPHINSGYPVPYEQGGQNVYYQHPHRRFQMQNGGGVVPPHMSHVRGGPPPPPHSFAAAHHDRMAAMHRNMAKTGGEYSMMMPPYAVESPYGMPPSYPLPPPPQPQSVSPPTTAQPGQQPRNAMIVSPTAKPADVVVVEDGSSPPTSSSLSPGAGATVTTLAAAKKRRLAPANESFPQKLHKILSDPQYRDLICWLPHGRAWRVLKPKSFEEKVIPHFFRSERYASFMRQVNGWGFKRIIEGLDANSYFHEQFLRGLPDVCSIMVRPQKGQQTSSCRDLGECPDFYKISQFAPLPEDDGEGQVAAVAAPAPTPTAPPQAASFVPNSNPAIPSAAPAPAIGISTSPPLMTCTTAVGQVGSNAPSATPAQAHARRVSVVASSGPPPAPQTYTTAPSPCVGVPSQAPAAESMEPVLAINNAGVGSVGMGVAADETAASATGAAVAPNSWCDADDWLDIPMFSPLTPLSPRPVYRKSHINGAPPVPQLPIPAQPTPQQEQPMQPQQPQQQVQPPQQQVQPPQQQAPPPSQPLSTGGGGGGARGLSEADLAYLTQQNRILLDQARRLQIDRSF